MPDRAETATIAGNGGADSEFPRARTPSDPSAAAFDRAYSALLCAELVVLGLRTTTTASGNLGVVTFKERTGRTVEFWAGAALRPDEQSAVEAAVHDALLTPWNGSVLAAGSARLVNAGVCRAAKVVDEHGTTTFGPTDGFPPLGGIGVTPEPGTRLAVRTPAGDFRALSLRAASVMLLVAPGWTGARRVEQWFDVLEDALAA
jgi:hypothetical protein